MNAFKEWLSDYLRYFILALAVLLAAGAIVLGVKLYQQSSSAQQAQAQGDPNNIVIVGESESESKEDDTPDAGTEGETKADTKKETEKKSDTEKKSEKETKEETKNETQKETKKETEQETQTETLRGVNAKPETAGNTETKQPETKQAETAPAETKPTEKQAQTENTRKEPPVIIPIQTEAAQTEPPQTEPPQTEPPQTEPPETDPPKPVYMTLNGACNFRSYPDYGDNIITYYSEGTVVEFLEDVGGWYKVQIDGMVGYMGARFFN